MEISDIKINAIRNLIDDGMAEETNREFVPCPNSEFTKNHAKKNSNFADVLQQELGIDVLDF